MIRDGRLGKGFNKEVAEYTSSLDFDQALFDYDILTDMAHLAMLVEQKIISKTDAAKVFGVLKDLEKNGLKAVEMDPGLEDIHMAIEAQIIREIGDAGGVLHTARSRNDQVACDLRMKTRDEVNLLVKALVELLSVLLEVAEKHTLTLMPSYTHLQHAQPTTLTHHMLSYVDALLRGLDRLEDAYPRIDLCPLGSGAVTGTSFPINRYRTAELLGFKGVLENTMDAVSTRDYMAETLSAAAIISLDISRMAEELIIWSTAEFGFIELDDSFASTSSIMPQKKNPDVLELIRARSGAVTGDLVSIFTILKALPQSYNRDLQQATPVFFGALETVTSSVSLLARVVGSLKWNEEKMRSATSSDFSTATELADAIVKSGKIPFRTAHQIVGTSVAVAVKDGLTPDQITPAYLDNIAESITGKKIGLSAEDVSKALTPLMAVKERKVHGGPAPEVVEMAVKERFDALAGREKRLAARETRLQSSYRMLHKLVNSIVGA